MENDNIEQLISKLVISPSNDILCEISHFLIEAQNHDLNSLVLKLFQSLFTLEHWAWEILSRDSREWHDDEEKYFELFSNFSSFNIKLILSNIDIKTKESLLLPTNTNIIDGIFQQIEKRKDDNDRFLSIINLWFDNLALLIHEYIELTSISIIIYINQRIISDIIMNNQFKIYLNQLKNSSPLITIKQLFYIKTCLFSLSGYLYSKPDNYLYNAQQIIEYLAEDYTNIILIHSQTISSWSKELLGCITHLIGLVTTCHWWIGIDDKILKMFIIPNKTLYDYIESLIDILSYRSFHKQILNQWLNNESILIDNILRLFKYLINFQDIIYFFRLQKNLFDIFLIFNHINNDRINLITYYLQSKIVLENEMKKLNITKNLNEIFFNYLQQAWNNPLKKFNKISIEELLKDLLNLSKNDIIKDAIINSNQLNFLIELSDKYLIIYDILWSLSFDIRIEKQLGLNEIFRNKLQNISTNKQMKNIIHGIQWNLNLNNIQFKTKTNNKENFDLIISYSHNDKLICTQLYNELIQNNYHVWIDFNENHENIIDAMVQATEQSRTIIICMSEQYKRSNFCRAQAQYAFKKQLKIIPILIEKYYQPDGWLSFLIGNLFNINFTKYEYSHAIQILLNELKRPQIAVIDSLVIRQQPQNITNLPISTLSSIDIHQWTQNDVQQWLMDNNLLHMARLLSDFNGLNLIYLSKLISNNSPQENLILFQEDSRKRTGKNVSLIEIARLHNLIEEQVRIPVKAKKWNPKNCCRMM